MTPNIPYRQPKPRTTLTRRQDEIIRLIAAGKTRMQIAAELFIEPATVKNHIQAIRVFYGVHTIADAVARWMEGKQR